MAPSEIRRRLLREAFTMDAIVLRDDRWHAIWTLPSGKNAYSKRWGWIKQESSRHRLAAGGRAGKASPAKQRQRRRGLCQPRFWEHTIEDDEDFSQQFDDVHHHPVKHGLVNSAGDWPWSSFYRWVGGEVYPAVWGVGSIFAANAFTEHSTGEP